MASRLNTMTCRSYHERDKPLTILPYIHQRTGRGERGGGWGVAAPQSGKLMYRPGKDTDKIIFMIECLDLFVLISQLA